MDAPDTVAAAVQLLESLGYRDDLALDDSGVRCGACNRTHAAERLAIRHTFRFEGATDPGDEAIVLGIECPDCGAKGMIVSAYGPDADAQLLALVDRLAP